MESLSQKSTASTDERSSAGLPDTQRRRGVGLVGEPSLTAARRVFLEERRKTGEITL